MDLVSVLTKLSDCDYDFRLINIGKELFDIEFIDRSNKAVRRFSAHSLDKLANQIDDFLQEERY